MNRIDALIDFYLGSRSHPDGTAETLEDRIADYLECETARAEETCRAWAKDILQMVDEVRGGGAANPRQEPAGAGDGTTLPEQHPLDQVRGER